MQFESSLVLQLLNLRYFHNKKSQSMFIKSRHWRWCSRCLGFVRGCGLDLPFLPSWFSEKWVAKRYIAFWKGNGTPKISGKPRERWNIIPFGQNSSYLSNTAIFHWTMIMGERVQHHLGMKRTENWWNFNWNCLHWFAHHQNPERVFFH